tara:strand:+ start:1298 stop:1423 length:126 start_codon:yes stop_codon:yes gene_type:complete
MVTFSAHIPTRPDIWRQNIPAAQEKNIFCKERLAFWPQNAL